MTYGQFLIWSLIIAVVVCLSGCVLNFLAYLFHDAKRYFK